LPAALREFEARVESPEHRPIPEKTSGEEALSSRNPSSGINLLAENFGAVMDLPERKLLRSPQKVPKNPPTMVNFGAVFA
jgi:hypothetical protein